MSIPNDNGTYSAFPTDQETNKYTHDQGLSKREYIIISLVQGLLAAHPTVDENFVITNAISIADKLLKEMAK